MALVEGIREFILKRYVEDFYGFFLVKKIKDFLEEI